MKPLLIIIFALVASTASAQKDTVGLNIPYADGTVVYEKIFDAPAKSKAELYNKAQFWLTDRYRNDIDFEIQDIVNGKLVARGEELFSWADIDGLHSYNNKITMQIDCKDGRYRCRIFNMVIEAETKDVNRIPIRPEDLVGMLLGKGDVADLNKNQVKHLLKSSNETIIGAIQSLNKAMTLKDDF